MNRGTKIDMHAFNFPLRSSAKFMHSYRLKGTPPNKFHAPCLSPNGLFQRLKKQKQNQLETNKNKKMVLWRRAWLTDIGSEARIRNITKYTNRNDRATKLDKLAQADWRGGSVLTSSHTASPALTWKHLISIGPSWSHLDSLDLSWTHLD